MKRWSMRLRPGMLRGFALIAALCLLAACKPEPLPPGVVATVNGHPITLRLVEARHDADGGIAAVSQNPSVELLQEQYGSILAELIVQELVAQELERLGMPVTEDDLNDGILRIRDDYSDDTFAEALFDDNIDEHAWKELVRYTLVMLRFNEQVLRPRIFFENDEVEKYYLERAAEFLSPAQNEFRIVSAATAEAVEAAKKRLAEGGSLLELGSVQVQNVALRPGLAPEVWQKDLAGLKEGQATRTREVNGLFQAVILEKRSPAQRMDPLEAYPHIEKVLLEWKMKTLFAEWLDAATADADIKVSPLLRKQERPAQPVSDVPLDSEPILGEEPEGTVIDGNSGVLPDEDGQADGGSVKPPAAEDAREP